tara:strand:- start:174 stop:377 length:204 start_codon:yes stop_codon:yes gene_type:complete
VVQNFITREELTRVIHKKSTSFFAAMGALLWLFGVFLLFVPLIIYTFILLIIFFPFYYVETKMKGEI